MEKLLICLRKAMTSHGNALYLSQEKAMTSYGKALKLPQRRVMKKLSNSPQESHDQLWKSSEFGSQTSKVMKALNFEP
jgi:hypothetical protein